MNVSRNEPCPCGSGLRFKRCCGKLADESTSSPPRIFTPTPADFDSLVDLFHAERYAELENRVRLLLEHYPNSGMAWKLLGTALGAQGKDALFALGKAAGLLPDDVDVHNNLGNALHELGQYDGAVASYRRAIEIRPDYAEAHSNLGLALQDLAQFDAAVTSYQRALALQPNSAEAHNNLGNALKDLGQLDAAVTSLRRALEINPNFAKAHSNLGNALKDLGQLGDAVASYRRALEIKPDYAEAHSNLGFALTAFGEFDDALTSYRQALALKPDYIEAHSNLLFALNYITSRASSYCLEAAREFGRIVSRKVLGRYSSWQFQTEPARLRVGLVSGDLRYHPVGYFLESLLAELDLARIELVAYSTSHKADELTVRIQPYFSAWKPLLGLSDEAAAHMIHADGVHVLLDISGHTAKNRLPLFAWKPAPVQASWLGYFATTGVEEMDYFLADAVSVPDVQRRRFTESVWYLPDTRLCFTPPELDLPIANLPALENGFLTFGCFQNLAKAGDDVLIAWGAILVALPDARLRWQCSQFRDPAVVSQCIQRLQQNGIDPDRVRLLGTVSRAAYLAAHAEVDVILDTFPFTGGTTTCEALWMGVPTLTLVGDSLVARQGASLLTAAGLPEWVATSEAEYVEKAIQLTADLLRLAKLRAGLRTQVLASPVCDAPRFARNLEVALWGMWRQWCAKQTA